MNNSTSIQEYPHAPSYVQAIAPYVGGKPIEELAREMGIPVDQIVKLASNENPLGIPNSAKTAMLKAMNDLGRYPDGNGFELKQILSQTCGVPNDWITLGNGSNDILELVARAYLQRDNEAIMAQYSFVVYGLATQAVGANSVVVPAKDYGHDLLAMLKAITPKTRLIFIANPNNPTGTFLTAKAIEDFLSQVPKQCLVVLDEAYNEYLEDDLRYDTINWVRQYPNLVISRTLSKAFGLAGLRVGYAIAHPMITDILNRIRQPFNVNSMAQAAAIAAVQDVDYLNHSKQINNAGYQQLTQAFNDLGLSYVPSKANFVLVHIGNRGGGANQVNQSLLKQGVIVRPVANYGLPDSLRVSIGLYEDNQRFIAALNKALEIHV